MKDGDVLMGAEVRDLKMHLGLRMEAGSELRNVDGL